MVWFLGLFSYCDLDYVLFLIISGKSLIKMPLDIKQKDH